MALHQAPAGIRRLLQNRGVGLPAGPEDDAAPVEPTEAPDPITGADGPELDLTAESPVDPVEPLTGPEAVLEPEPEAVLEPEPEPEPVLAADPEPEPEPAQTGAPNPDPLPFNLMDLLAGLQRTDDPELQPIEPPAVATQPEPLSSNIEAPAPELTYGPIDPMAGPTPEVEAPTSAVETGPEQAENPPTETEEAQQEFANAAEAFLAAAEEQLPRAELITNMSMEDAARLLDTCVIVDTHCSIPSVRRAIKPTEVLWTPGMEQAASKIIRPGQLYLLPRDLVAELGKPIGRVRSWLSENTFTSRLGPLVPQSMWLPANAGEEDYEDPRETDWAEVEANPRKPVPSNHSSFLECWCYNKYCFEKTVNAIIDAYDEHIATQKEACDAYATELYNNLLAVIRETPDAYPHYAARPGADGKLMPLLNDQELTCEKFCQMYWDRVKADIPSPRDIRRKWRMELEVTRPPRLVPEYTSEQQSVFEQELADTHQRRMDALDTALRGVTGHIYSYLYREAVKLVGRIDESDELRNKSSALFRALYRKLRNLNVTGDTSLDQLANDLEAQFEVAPAERNYQAIRQLLVEGLKHGYREAALLELPCDRELAASLEDVELDVIELDRDTGGVDLAGLEANLGDDVLEDRSEES